MRKTSISIARLRDQLITTVRNYLQSPQLLRYEKKHKPNQTPTKTVVRYLWKIAAWKKSNSEFTSDLNLTETEHRIQRVFQKTDIWWKNANRNLFRLNEPLNESYGMGKFWTWILATELEKWDKYTLKTASNFLHWMLQAITEMIREVHQKKQNGSSKARKTNGRGIYIS